MRLGFHRSQSRSAGRHVPASFKSSSANILLAAGDLKRACVWEEEKIRFSFGAYSTSEVEGGGDQAMREHVWQGSFRGLHTAMQVWF